MGSFNGSDSKFGADLCIEQQQALADRQKAADEYTHKTGMKVKPYEVYDIAVQEYYLPFVDKTPEEKAIAHIKAQALADRRFPKYDANGNRTPRRLGYRTEVAPQQGRKQMLPHQYAKLVKQIAREACIDGEIRVYKHSPKGDDRNKPKTKAPEATQATEEESKLWYHE